MKKAADRSMDDHGHPCTARTSRPSKNTRSNAGVVGRKSRRGEGREAVVAKPYRKDLVMGEVKILKRREKIIARDVKKDEAVAVVPNEKVNKSVLRSTDPIGPEPGILPVQMKIIDQKGDGYAMSGFLESPAPSSLPKPSFMKKDLVDPVDLATNSLRYLLRLDVI